MHERILDRLGSLVDELFLAPGRLVASFQARRAVDWPSHARETAFYHEMGYVDEPATFFSRPEQKPAYRIESQTPYHGGACQTISFPSGFVPRNPSMRSRYAGFPENRTGYLVRWFHGDHPRPTVLCVHGFMMGAPREAERMFKIRTLFDLGLDAALCVLPFHWERVRGPRGARRIYLTLGDTSFTNECIAQSVHDLDNAFLIMNDQGQADIGMVGASLGGYVTGLYACLRDHMRFAALMVPALSFLRPLRPDAFLKRAPFDAVWRSEILRAADFHSPLNLTPRIPSEDILVVASRGDRVCPFDLVEELERRWRLPNCHFRTGGHWLVFDTLRGHAWYGFLKAMGFIDGTR